MGVDVVVIAVDASKEITDYALEWAIRNVIHPMDSLILLALIPSAKTTGNRSHQSGIQQFLSCLIKKCHKDKKSLSDHESLINGNSHAKRQRITEVCLQMIRQLLMENNLKQVQTQVTIVADAQMGAVAAKAEELGANWVILDRRLKKEGDFCVKELECNIVLIDHAIPKVLQTANSESMKKVDGDIYQNDPSNVADMLGVFQSYSMDSDSFITSSSLGMDSRSRISQTDNSYSLSSREKHSAHKTTPINNTQPAKRVPQQYLQIVPRGTQASYHSNPSSKSQPLTKVSVDMDEALHKSSPSSMRGRNKSYSGVLKSDTNRGTNLKLQPTALIPTRRSTDSPRFRQSSVLPVQSNQLRRASYDEKRTNPSKPPCSPPVDRTSSIRRVMSLSIKQPPTPPPLCSVCKHNAPIFGKPPRKFSYEEIRIATDGFSSANFLAQGGYGLVFRGIMPDGRVVAVKQHKSVSAQGASEFCSEVEVLSCAQHRNLVMLVGYCTEPEWLLVYEFACNGSLDKHLYSSTETEETELITWRNRMKVAIGAARGLRYLHEDCRVGCIVHRDLRPKNILLTHDFEPMVGDFGLARWQADGQSAEETRVIGAFGYLAPEYTQTGLITEKADVYAFGVVLLELLSGMKATDLSRNEEQHYLPDWGRNLLENRLISDIIDPRLEGNYVNKEVEAMMCAASLCISPSPERRPRMSKVLRILEGDMPIDTAHQYGEPTTTTTFVDHRRKKSYTEGRLFIQNNQIPDYSSSQLIQIMHKKKLSSSSPTADRGDFHKRNISSSPLENHIEKLKITLNKNLTEEPISEEYQTYLQGSLEEFIHKMN